MSGSKATHQQTLSQRILRRLLLGCLGLTAVLGLVLAGWEYSQTRDRVSSEFDRLSLSFVPSLSEALWSKQVGAVRMMVLGIAENPVVGSVRVEDETGQSLSQYSRGQFSAPSESFWSLPAVSVELGRDDGAGWQKLGRLVITPDTGLLRAQIWRSLQASLLLAILFTLAIWLLLQRIVKYTVAVPLARLTAEIEAADDNPQAGPLSYPYRDDIGVLVDALNGMRARLVAANRGLSVALDAAEQASRVKAEFLANMSHEIRTPMNAVMGMTQLALRADPPPRVQDYLQKIQTSSRHLLGVINDILDFSKIEAQKLNLEHAEFELEPVLGDLADVCAEKAFGKGLEFVIDIARDVPTALVGDALRLDQVLINLTNNAIKFTEHGEVAIRVTLQERRSDSVLLRFAVRDTGIGLSEQQRQSLFQSFQQADSSITRKFGGTGLGLAISKRLVELMGGEIGVESVPGAGSTFWFTVRMELAAGQTRPGPTLPDLRGRKALVVDDNEPAREVLAEILRGMGLVVLPVPCGKQALAELEQADRTGAPFAIVLTDWKMPGMDGIELADALRHLPLAQPPLLLMATAYDSDQARPLAEAVGIREVLAKPVTPSSLLEAVTRQFAGTPSPVPGQEQPAIATLAQADALVGARALLVEDNELNQEVATEFLQALGLQVSLAENGELALRMLQQQDYDVVLMDMQMPVMDGLTATRQIRQLPGFQQLPILAMTANAMADDRERCQEAGMNDHIAKPIDPQDLTDKLLRWVKPAIGRVADAAVCSAVAVQQPAQPVRAGQDMCWAALEQINGLDSRLGLSQAAGRKPLYLSLLSKFVADQADAPDRLAQAIAAADWSEAERLAHTLKGVSAQVGALPLRDCAASLEQLIRQRQAPAGLEAPLAQLKALLPPLLQAIAAALPHDEADKPLPAASFDPQQWQALRERLTVLLQESDTEAVALFEANKALARQALGPRFESVAQALGQFDFAAAQELVTQA